MSTLMEPSAATEPRNNRAVWGLQVALALVMASAALPKLAGADAAVEAFDEIGAGQWLRVPVGGLELAGALGLVVPRLAGLAAAGFAALMVGATITNIFLVDEPATAVLTAVLGVVFVVVARIRWARVGWVSAPAEERS